MAQDLAQDQTQERLAGPPDDEALARQAGSNRAAFAELYQRYLDCVYRYHLARTGCSADADDLTAQTFLAALESVRDYQGRGSFAAWLFGIASHKAVDFFRQGRHELPLESAESLPTAAVSPEERLEERLHFRRVAQALHALPQDRAEAIVLRIYAGLSAAEAAQVMHRSEAAVKMLVHRGLGDLRQRLLVPGEEA